MNLKQVLLREQARQDAGQIVEFYVSEASFQVARSFLVALREDLEHISRFPTSGSLRYGDMLHVPNLRSWPIKDFPYLVLYVEQESNIEVYRVLHTARDVLGSLSEGGED